MPRTQSTLSTKVLMRCRQVDRLKLVKANQEVTTLPRVDAAGYTGCAAPMLAKLLARSQTALRRHHRARIDNKQNQFGTCVGTAALSQADNCGSHQSLIDVLPPVSVIEGPRNRRGIHEIENPISIGLVRNRPGTGGRPRKISNSVDFRYLIPFSRLCFKNWLPFRNTDRPTKFWGRPRFQTSVFRSFALPLLMT